MSAHIVDLARHKRSLGMIATSKSWRRFWLAWPGNQPEDHCGIHRDLGIVERSAAGYGDCRNGNLGRDRRQVGAAGE